MVLADPRGLLTTVLQSMFVMVQEEPLHDVTTPNRILQKLKSPFLENEIYGRKHFWTPSVTIRQLVLRLVQHCTLERLTITVSQINASWFDHFWYKCILTDNLPLFHTVILRYPFPQKYLYVSNVFAINQLYFSRYHKFCIDYFNFGYWCTIFFHIYKCECVTTFITFT